MNQILQMETGTTERWETFDRQSRYEVSSLGRVRSSTTGKLLTPDQRGRVQMWFPPSPQHPFGRREYYEVAKLVSTLWPVQLDN